MLGRYAYRAHDVFNVKARGGAEEVNELVWERLTKMSPRRAPAPSFRNVRLLTCLCLYDLDIDVGLRPDQDLWQLITVLEHGGACPDLSSATLY